MDDDSRPCGGLLGMAVIVLLPFVVVIGFVLWGWLTD